jgi:hypothetical protein
MKEDLKMKDLKDDYSGPFEPDFHLGKLSRSALTSLGREYMIFGQINDRVGLPQVALGCGFEVYKEVAIDEWMGASPIYTQRMRKTLCFEGDDVSTIMKGLQLDVGFSHQYYDIGWEIESEQRGAFWVNSCGALMDVEPRGEDIVFMVCHDIEDPTFPATAVATNPRARIRPIHRPPRQPVDRVPHCHWTIEIDPDAEPVKEIALTQLLRRSRLAQVELERPEDAEPGGWPDYERPLDPEFQLEDLSHGALVVVCKEFAVQDHLLVRSLMTTLAEREGEGAAREVAQAQWNGAGFAMSQRLQKAMAISGDGAEAILKVLQLHPAFQPAEYIHLGFELTSDSRGRFWIKECDALNEEEPWSWFALLGDSPNPALDAMVQAVNPRARCIPIKPSGPERLAWEVVVDTDAEPAAEPREVEFARLSGAWSFAFTRRRPLRT